VNFKEIIEEFLKKSLMVYLRYNDQIKKILKEEESKQKDNFNISEFNNEILIDNSKLLESINSLEKEKIILEKISEKSLEEKAVSSEEYDIYNNNNSSNNYEIKKDYEKIQSVIITKKPKIFFNSQADILIMNKENLFSDSEKSFNFDERKSKLEEYENKAKLVQIKDNMDKLNNQEFNEASIITRRINKEKEEIQFIFDKSRNYSTNKNIKQNDDLLNKNNFDTKENNLSKDNYLTNKFSLFKSKYDSKLEENIKDDLDRNKNDVFDISNEENHKKQEEDGMISEGIFFPNLLHVK
jgi:hypothetical protein